MLPTSLLPSLVFYVTVKNSNLFPSAVGSGGSEQRRATGIASRLRRLWRHASAELVFLFVNVDKNSGLELLSLSSLSSTEQ